MTIWEDRKSKKRSKKEKREKRKSDTRYQETRYTTKDNTNTPALYQNETTTSGANSDEFGNVLPFIPIVDCQVKEEYSLWKIVRTKFPSVNRQPNLDKRK
jgi:hypothetical protein